MDDLVKWDRAQGWHFLIPWKYGQFALSGLEKFEQIGVVPTGELSFSQLAPLVGAGTVRRIHRRSEGNLTVAFDWFAEASFP